MKIISTRAHGIMDYTVSLFIMGSPWLFGFAQGGAETYVPVAAGLAGVSYSLFTAYEFGMVRTISMKTHLLLDTLSGLILALSPWLFGFAETIYLPHIIMGALEIIVVVLTDPVPESTYSHEERYDQNR